MQTILVVDDQPLVLDVVRCMLEASGFAVRLAANGEAAVAAYREEPLDVVLMDVDMPVMNGVESCRELRRIAAERDRPLRVSLMTGVWRPELAAAAESAGACGVLPKPFTIAELVGQIRSMLEPQETQITAA